MERKVSLSILGLQDQFGALRALDITKAIGCNNVGFRGGNPNE